MLPFWNTGFLLLFCCRDRDRAKTEFYAILGMVQKNMHFSNYVLIALTLACFPLVKIIALCCRQKISTIHQEVDLLGIIPTEFLNELDRKFGSRWVIPFGLLFVSLYIFQRFSIGTTVFY